MVDEAETLFPPGITFLARSTNWVFGATHRRQSRAKICERATPHPNQPRSLTGTKSNRGRSPLSVSYLLNYNCNYKARKDLYYTLLRTEVFDISTLTTTATGTEGRFDSTRLCVGLFERGAILAVTGALL